MDFLEAVGIMMGLAYEAELEPYTEDTRKKILAMETVEDHVKDLESGKLALVKRGQNRSNGKGGGKRSLIKSTTPWKRNT